MIVRRLLACSAVLLAACAARVPAPTMAASAVRVETPRIETPPVHCQLATPEDPRHASLLAFAHEAVARAGVRVSRSLCVDRIESVRDVAGRERVVVMDVVVRDDVSAEAISFRLWANQRGDGGPWEETFFEERVAEDFAMLSVPRWLASQPDLRMFWREVVEGHTALMIVTAGTDTAVCLERNLFGQQGMRPTPRSGRICWSQPGHVVDVTAWDFAYAEPSDLDEAPEWSLELALASGAFERAAFRALPGGAFERASVLPPARWGMTRRPRPSWLGPIAARAGEAPQSNYRPVAAREALDPGPLGLLHVEPFSEGRVLVARTMLADRVCARLDAWVCSAPSVLNESGARFSENVVIDATVLGPTTIGVVRSMTERSLDGSGGAWLEVFDAVDGLLVRRGAITVGTIAWRNAEPSSGRMVRHVTRLFHRVRFESEGCVRIDEPEHFVGDAHADFTPREGGTALNLPRAADAIAWTRALPDLDQPLLDLAGFWRLTSVGLSRVASCTDESTTRLVAPSLPSALSVVARSCLDDLSRAADMSGPLPRLAAGLSRPCGARAEGFYSGPHLVRFVYDGDRLSESRERYEQGDSTYFLAFHEVYRGGSHVGQTLASTHYVGGAVECVNTRQASYTRDRQGHLLTERVSVDTCEGVDSGLFISRYTWTHGAAHEEAVVARRHHHDEGANRSRQTYVPNERAPEAMVVVEEGETRGTCWLDLRDEQGNLRERRFGGARRWEYAYVCEGAEWPE